MAILRVAHVWGDRLLEVAHLSNGALGPVTVEAGQVRLDGAAVAVEPGQPKELAWGGTRFRLEWAEPVQRVKPPAADERDWRFFSLLACLLLFAAASIAVFRLDVELFGGESDELFGKPVVTDMRIIKVLQPEQRHAADRLRAQKPEGQAGKPNEKRRESSSKSLQAKQAGLLIALDQLGGMEQVLGGGPSDAIVAGLGNLKGPAVGDAQGFAGMGSRGNGPGGGGLFPGAFGGRLTQGPKGPGGFGHDLSGKNDSGPGPQRTIVSDGLSRDVVAKVIRRHESEIKFCYEQALQHSPGLSGKVTVMFTIGPAGDVTDASIADSSMPTDEAAQCMLQRVKRWRFPEPQGGGVVNVTHPWIFSEAGTQE
jgi:TonB family protein